jgi:hypothetical protein
MAQSKQLQELVMTTAQTRKTPKDDTAPAAAIFNYLDTLSAQHEKFAESMKESRARAHRYAEEMSEALLAGQRDMLGIARQIVGNPTDMGANSKAIMELATAAQERSLSLGKFVYTEQAQVGAEVRKFWETSFATPPSFMPSMPAVSNWFPKFQ